MASMRKWHENAKPGHSGGTTPTAALPSQAEISTSSRRGFKPVYNSFDDSKTQIRLLKLCSGQKDILSFKTSIWNFDDAPAYVAISYTWGDQIMEQISVDGRDVHVRYNAWYSLGQVAHHWPRHYVWMDSICIDQGNEAEKSAQVAMMWQIYEAAAEVASCLGAHEGDSEWLSTILVMLWPLQQRFIEKHRIQDFQSLWPRNQDYRERHGIHGIQGEQGPSILYDELWTCLLGALPQEIQIRLVQAFIQFANRPYWRRVWVLQEMVANKKHPRVLAGRDRHEVIALYSWSHLMEGSPVTSDHWKMIISPAVLYHVMAQNMCYVLVRGKESLLTELESLLERECTDPRDRLFGILGLINWEESACQPILPDYSKSAWEFAATLVSILDFYGIELILYAFGLSASHEDMIRCAEKQRLQSTDSSNRHHAHESTIKVKISRSYRRRKPTRSDCDRLGTLRPWDSTVQSMANFRMRVGGISQSIGPFPEDRLAPMVFSSSKLTLLLCPDAREGDTIVALSSAASEPAVLVVREQSGESGVYDIIGQGLNVEGSFMRNSDTGEGFSAFVEIDLTAEEALLLVGQDLIGLPNPYVYSPEARLLRLWTSPARMPKGAVRIHYPRRYKTRISASGQDHGLTSEEVSKCSEGEDSSSQEVSDGCHERENSTEEDPVINKQEQHRCPRGSTGNFSRRSSWNS